MIKIENLTKLYKAKKQVTCCALDNVSTTLPDTGLVFILGKSGSGKSTLLNLIGGLDSFDSGDIVSFGNSLASFTEEDYEAYRSDFVSFVFQDYHLIDELTVLENITLFNSEVIDGELLRDTLDTVGMTEYVNRYPSELSGGQKQRVAIARGIIKNPHVILCDEPTGNLDKQTSYQILELLKKLSKRKLIVIVSHNMKEAETFADRIIELADGKIITDVARDAEYSDEFCIEDGKATLPYHNRMAEEDLERLNSAIRDGEVREVAVNTSGFDPVDLDYVDDKKELKLRILAKANIRKLFKKFFFSKYKIAISTVILSFLMFGLFSIIQSFINFDPNTAIVKAMDEERSVIAFGRDYTSFPNNIYEDLTDIVDGETTYKLYSQTIWLDSRRGNSWDSISKLSDKSNMEELYIHETYGILVCDDAYLNDIFAVDGEIKLLAGSMDDARNSSALLITDFFADSIIYHEKAAKLERYLTYNDIVSGVFKPKDDNVAARIVGIIDTDYEERYKGIFDKHAELISGGVDAEKELQNFITGDPGYIKFADDVVLNLGVAYSLNPNFIDSFTFEETSLVRCNGLYFVSPNGTIASGKKLNYMTTKSKGLKPSDFGEREIAVPYDIYNALYGTNYSEADTNKLGHITPQVVVVQRHVDNDLEKPVVYSETFTITAISQSRMVANEDTMMLFKRLDWKPSGIYIKDPKGVEKIVDFVDNSDYSFIARSQKNVQRINELVFTFRDLFILLEVTSVLMIILFLVLFGIRSIKQNSYQIGVIKALGGRNRDVEKIFVIKTLIIGIFIAIVSTSTSVFFIKAANSVLIASIETVLAMSVADFEVISFIPKLILFDGIFMIALSCISALIPVILLKKIKPVEIIKAKE